MTLAATLALSAGLLGCVEARSLASRWRARRRFHRSLQADRAPAARLAALASTAPGPAAVAALISAATASLAFVAPAAALAFPPAIAIATVGVNLGRRSWMRAAHHRERRRQMPAALDRLAAALRAGASVPAALSEAAPTLPPPLGPELEALARRAGAGRPVTEVLDSWAAHHDDAGTRLAATALVLATTVGGAPGRAVDGVARTLRERLELADERRALAAQAQLSALVLAAAPLAFAIVLGAAGGGPAAFLLSTPTGWACLVLGVGLDAAGAWWMARLIRGRAAT